jgi:hypothetical protein
MENAVEADQWHNIIQMYPEWMSNYHTSMTVGFDPLIKQYTQLVDGRTELTEEVMTDILFSLAKTHETIAQLQTDGTLLVQGRGMYYAEDEQTFDFIDGSPGISGYFTGFHIDRLPLYHDMVYRKKMIYRPLLCIALDGYSLHNKDNTPGIFVDDTVVIPIIGQDLCITHSDSTSVIDNSYQ